MKKRMVAFLLAFMCAFSLAACGQKEVEQEGSQEENTEQKETYTFGYSCINMNNPFFIALEDSLRENLETAGHTLVTKDAVSDSETQNTQIEELIEEGVDAIFLSPVDWAAVSDSVAKIKEAGIKLINIDTEIQVFDQVDAFVGSNNKQAGKLCGQDLLERMPKGGKVLILECPDRNSVNDRIKGFEEAIAKKGFEVIGRINAKSDLSVALEEVDKALDTYPEIDVIMCGNDPAALGALVAVNAEGRKDIIIYGIDGSPEVKKEIAKDNSLIVATIGQSTKAMGEEAAKVAVQILNGEDFEKTTYLDTFIINHDNVEEYGIDTWQ